MTTARDTLVAWYGEKHAAFASWLFALQHFVLHECGDAFVPYDVQQIHATLIDLGKPGETRDFEHWIGTEFARSIEVRFGGNRPTDQTQTSRGKPRHERRFSIQGDKVVLIGWCEEPFLGDFRSRCEQFDFRHPYHTPDALDDDVYMRIGLIRGAGVDDITRSDVERRAREWLARRELELSMALTDLRIVRYEDDTLPLASSRARAVQIDHAPPGA